MVSRDSPFSRPSAGAFGMGALGVLSVGLISGGLWYDSHRSAEAVDRAREQVAAGQSAQRIPEPGPAPTSERASAHNPEGSGADRSAEQSVERSVERSVEAPHPAEVRYVTPATSVPTAVAASRTTAPQARPAQAPAVVPAAPAPATVDPSGRGPSGGEAGAPASTTPDPPELEVTHPGEAGFVPPPRLPELLLPFLPQVNRAPQADLATPTPEESSRPQTRK